MICFRAGDVSLGVGLREGFSIAFYNNRTFLYDMSQCVHTVLLHATVKCIYFSMTKSVHTFSEW